jgi:hypothetical protein
MISADAPTRIIVVPRYFFHIHNHRSFSDRDGEELPDDNAAWREALRTLKTLESNLDPGQQWRLSVRGPGGTLFEISIDTARLG